MHHDATGPVHTSITEAGLPAASRGLEPGLEQDTWHASRSCAGSNRRAHVLWTFISRKALPRYDKEADQTPVWGAGKSQSADRPAERVDLARSFVPDVCGRGSPTMPSAPVRSAP